ncbi:transcriptional regulator family: Fungal Specific TF [Penicillium riverlandense]|uniref:transcriptional regulator family: Fungal Specific TF n=1 Tax=Penicillium riverlandense TaxID=1903569 RepID=UPI0025484529|nr:transcriptional regulator family: Fungal Specific TF [Penicillium riverlandense]KAJ5820297.1 transcriptional regulator family: Fungal Specific TF [Penicillium riverlandense]
MNCVDAGVECHRTRETRIHRPRVSRLDALAARLAKLEESNSAETSVKVSSAAAHSHVASPQAKHHSPHGSFSSQYTDPAYEKKRKQYAAHGESIILSPPEIKRNKTQGAVRQKVHEDSPDSTRHASEAREFIEHELQCNPELSTDRRTALELARKFVSQLTNPALHWESGESRAADHIAEESLQPPTLTPELLYMLLPGPDNKTNSQGTLSWPDHISDKALERMGLAIIEGSECEQVLQYYRISVRVKAIASISKLAPLISSERLKVHFRTLKKQYEVAAQEELNQLPLAAAPSLGLLQSLLSGSRLMQYQGNMSRCWMFTALASRIIVSLGYHNITDTEPRNEVEGDIHACVYTCYYFDKTLSLLLLRPPSLPDLKVEPAQLIHVDPDLPTSAMIVGIVEYSHLKHTLLDVLLDTKVMRDVEKANILSNLVERAHSIHSNLQTFRRRQELEFPGESWNFLRREWLSMDFNYYSVLTTIIRVRSSVLKSRLICEDCLYAARESLTTLRALQETFSGHITSVDSYPYFLTWTMLLFPLAPFFVLFCNVVATSDQRDFNMIKNITDDLHQFVGANPSIDKLYRLFSKFLDLCAPLIQLKPALPRPERPSPAVSAATTLDNIIRTDGVQMERGVDFLGPAATTTTNQAWTTPPGWDDSLVWELFDNQPSLGWAESDLWDVMAQLPA